MTNTRATDFQKAFRNLQLQPLISADDRAKFYVPYGEELLPELTQIITDCTDSNNQLVFAGHRGCGKSTLLSEFSRLIADRYFTVFFSISELVEASSIDHIQILFVIALQLMEQAVIQKIAIPKDKQQAIFNWFKQRTQTETVTTGADIEVGFNLFEIIKGKLKADSQVRDEIKTNFQQNFRELTENINSIATEITQVCNKKIVVIIDDIDKLDLAQVEEIFQKNIKALLQPKFIVIYTIPIATIRDGVLKTHIEDETGNNIYFMPVQKIHPYSNRNDAVPETLKDLSSILGKRVEKPELFAPGITDQIALYSGDVLRELIRIAQECCRLVRVQILRNPQQEASENRQIDTEILNEALQNLRNSMEITLSQTDRDILQTTYSNYRPTDPKQQEFLDLLHNTYIIEYRNGKSWYDFR